MKLAVFLALVLASGYARAQSAQFTCSNSQMVTVSTIVSAGSTRIVANPTATLGRSAQLYLCSYSVQVTLGGTATTFSLTSGTGTNCGTGNVPLTLAATGTASSSPSIGAVFTSDAAIGVPINADVCLTLGGAVAASSVNLRYIVQ